MKYLRNILIIISILAVLSIAGWAYYASWQSHKIVMSGSSHDVSDETSGICFQYESNDWVNCIYDDEKIVSIIFAFKSSVLDYSHDEITFIDQDKQEIKIVTRSPHLLRIITSEGIFTANLQTLPINSKSNIDQWAKSGNDINTLLSFLTSGISKKEITRKDNLLKSF